MAIATTVAAAAVTYGPVIAAGASAYNAYQSWDAAKDANQDAKDLQKLKTAQAEDIIGQIEAEEFIYKDDLDMIQKQTALVEDKLQMQTASAFEQTGDTLATVVAGSYGSKYEGGAGKRSARKAREAMKEEGQDLLQAFEMGQEEIGLQNEEAERQAEIRYNQIIGQLEANYLELTGEEMPGATASTSIPHDAGENVNSGMNKTDQELEELYDEQANTDY